MPYNLIKKINSITDTDTLEMLHHHAVLCNSIEDFESNLNNIGELPTTKVRGLLASMKG